MQWNNLPKDIKQYIFLLLIRDSVKVKCYNRHTFYTRIETDYNINRIISLDLRMVQFMNRLCFNKECKHTLKSLCKFEQYFWTFKMNVF